MFVTMMSCYALSLQNERNITLFFVPCMQLHEIACLPLQFNLMAQEGYEGLPEVRCDERMT